MSGGARARSLGRSRSLEQSNASISKAQLCRVPPSRAGTPPARAPPAALRSRHGRHGGGRRGREPGGGSGQPVPIGCRRRGRGLSQVACAVVVHDVAQAAGAEGHHGCTAGISF